MSENKNKLVELRTFTTWLGDDGICYTVVKSNVEINLQDALAITAIAMLINSPGSRIIGNFFLGINKPSVPTKLFNEKNKAIEWLKQFVNNK